MKNPVMRPHFLRYFVIGLVTVAPLAVTWVVLDFLFSLLARTGAPALLAVAHIVRPLSDTVSDWLLDPGVQYVLAALLTVAGLYGIGLLASIMLGRRLIGYVERQFERLPLINTIYGTTKRFLHTLRQPNLRGQRVVLISFPSRDMKAVGFVTKVLRDTESGRELAAVYVPTAPNPTSGYIEIVPLDQLVQTDWTFEEAMTFVVTAGANSPQQVRFDQPDPPTPGADGR